MCLTDIGRELIAEEDIVCYKHLRHGKRSEFFEFKYEKGKVYQQEIEVSRGDHFGLVRSEIKRAFHSYKKPEFAMAEQGAVGWDDVSEVKLYVWKCIIPKGSKYYIGAGCSVDSFASNSIVLLKIVHNWVYVPKNIWR